MAFRFSLQWRWFFGLTGLLAALLGVVILGSEHFLRPYIVGTLQKDLERNGRVVRHFAAPLLVTSPVPVQEINQMAQTLGKETGLRVTIMTADGTVVGESDKPPELLVSIENHRYRPEVVGALTKGVGADQRRSSTTGQALLYVAQPVLGGDDRIVGVVRVALSLQTVEAIAQRVFWIVAVAGLMVWCLSVPMLFLLARRWSRPIETMRQMAVRVAGGDFSRTAPRDIGGELGELAGALNEMASQLAARLRELDKEKAELSAVLAGMTEGVLVADDQGRIRLINRALRQQFQLGDETIGKTVLEVFRNVELEKLVTTPTACELAFLTPSERVFAVNAASLPNHAGVVMVFHDITRLKQLENVRKEFVANVSHELRTPLSIIKGYVETLLEEPPPDPSLTRQFLEIIRKHSQRLENLIEDLLNISALESQQARLELETLSLCDVARSVAEELAKQAREKSMDITLEFPDALPMVRGDRRRLHQVFVNLLDNAIKYTPTGGRITICARQNGNEIECCVADNGPGIAAEHLPRIFERFYRVDKARSRELGGTGLGLSIVKHIVQTHGGRVWAESRVGEGSRFYFTVPLATERTE